MAESKTMAQRRLLKYQEALRESRKNKKINQEQSPRKDPSKGDLKRNLDDSKSRSLVNNNKESIKVSNKRFCIDEEKPDKVNGGFAQQRFERTKARNVRSSEVKNVIPKVSESSREKRKSDHEEPIEKTKIPKIKKNEDSSYRKIQNKLNCDEMMSEYSFSEKKEVGKGMSKISDLKDINLKKNINSLQGKIKKTSPSFDKKKLNSDGLDKGILLKQMKSKGIEKSSPLKTYKIPKLNFDEEMITESDSIEKRGTSISMYETSNSKDPSLKKPLKFNISKEKCIKTPISQNEKHLNSVGVGEKRNIRKEVTSKGIETTSILKSKLQARLQKIIRDTKSKSKLKNNIEEPEIESNKTVVIEAMDWEPLNDDILRSIRHEVDPREQLMEWQDISVIKLPQVTDNSLFIVVDTNVLIRNIKLMERLAKAVIKGFKITLVIPWQVLKELDNLKQRSNYENVSKYARKASHYLAEVSGNSDMNITFQTQREHFEKCSSDFVVEVPDDHLIKCCIQFKSLDQKVLLLSNDVNLRVKTTTSRILAVDEKWILCQLNDSTSKRKPHCYETEPEDYQTSFSKRNCPNFIYKATEILRIFFYNVSFIKLKENYNELWPLWAPESQYLQEVLNFMISDTNFKSYWLDLNLIRMFYHKKKSYNGIEPKDVEWLGRKSVSLAHSMFSSGIVPGDLVSEFFKHLGFLKTQDSAATDNYVDGSFKLAQKYFSDCESSLNEFVSYLENLYSVRGPSLQGNKDVFHHIDLHLKLIWEFRNSILMFQEIQERLALDNEVAKTLHKVLCDFLEGKKDEQEFPVFSPEDIIEFVNQNRSFISPALSWLTDQECRLLEIQKRLK